MSWHYQIKEFENKGQKYYQMIEVYSGPYGTSGPITPVGETPSELIRDLEMMLNDARKYPVSP